ncbi:hypothetical protein DVQ60_20335 [Yersinia enterocolitica]|nr:hypothetical protein [Yersinia enterocolitica]
MLKINSPAIIDPADQNKLDAIPEVDRPNKWDTSRTNAIKNFKKEIMTHGLKEQDNRCAWCTLPVGATGRRTAHRDHIAPKKLYPKWTFHAKNLVVVCEYCNGFSVKSDLNTVKTEKVNYDDIEFFIVHPYLHETEKHIRFREQEGDEPGVVVEGISPEGIWTVNKLKLQSDGLTLLRAQELVYYRNINKLPHHFQSLLNQATGRQ